MEQAMLAAVRAIHFASAIVLFGEFVHRAVVAPEGAMPARVGRSAAWAMTVFIATALAWLALEAVSMSGMPAAEALGARTLTVVATQTIFGRAWLVRMGLALALVLVLVVLYRSPSHRVAQSLGALLAALILGLIACEGHAVAGRGLDGALHLCGDAVHLVAAGAWLGALLPLIRLLSQSPDLAFAARATRRFSALGMASMAAILLSGITNAYYMLPDAAALTGSPYGQLLLAKIVLFIVILALAAINRVVLTPRLAGVAGGDAVRRLRVTAIIECALGFGIVAIVGQLGITMPAMTMPELHHH